MELVQGSRFRLRLRFRTFEVRSCCDMSNTREPPEVATISFQNRTDNLKVELPVIVHGDIAESNHGAHKGGGVSYFLP